MVAQTATHIMATCNSDWPSGQNMDKEVTAIG